MLELRQITGKEAFTLTLAALMPVNGSQELWFKSGHNKFTVIDQFSPDAEIWHTAGQLGDRYRTRLCKTTAYDYLRAQSENQDDGIFYIPSQPQGAPIKTCILFSDDISAEMDDGTFEEQWAKIKRFCDVTGLIPTIVNGSGGKSVHVHFKTIEHIPVDMMIFLRRLLAICLRSDPAIVNPHQPMRMPGFWRDGKKAEQALYFVSDERYTLEGFVEGFKLYFADMGWTFPGTLPDHYWRGFVKLLKLPTDEQRCQALKQELEFGVNGYEKERERLRLVREQRLNNRSMTFAPTENLIDLVNQANERADSTFFANDPSWRFSGDHARGCCPFHESTSKNSAWISRKDSGWRFHCPTCTDNKGISAFMYWYWETGHAHANHPSGKDWVEAAKKFCAVLGIEVPSQTSATKIVEQKESKLGLLIKKLGGLFGGLRKAKKGGLLQEKDGYFTYKPGDGAKAYEELVRIHGYKRIMDISATGSGKTHAVSQCFPKNFYADPEDDYEYGQLTFRQLLYLCPSHRNPHNEVIETQFHEVTARTNGYVYDWDKRTPANNPYRYTVPQGETGFDRNCHLTDIFHKISEAGHSREGICGSCQHFADCKSKQDSEQGYGYLETNNDYASEVRVRGHHRSFPDDYVDKTKIIIQDEAEMVDWVESMQVTADDVATTFRYIKGADKELYQRLSDFRESLDDVFDDVNNKSPKWGWNQTQLRKHLIAPDLSDEDIDKIYQIELGSRPELEVLKKKKPLHKVYLAQLIKVLQSKVRGSVSGNNTHLNITKMNESVIKKYLAAYAVIFQDATFSRKQLALALGIDESEIALVKMELPTPVNITVKQYIGAGKFGFLRSENEQSRGNAIREYFVKQFGDDVGFIEKKAYKKAGDLIQGGDAHGSNAYQTKTHVVSFGAYNPNLGATLDEYQTIANTQASEKDEQFLSYYSHKEASNEIQQIGRLRAGRRPQEELVYHTISETNLDYLRELGFRVEVIDIKTLDQSFVSPHAEARYRYIQMGKEFVREMGVDAFEDVSQNGFAKWIDRTSSAVGRMLKKMFSVSSDDNAFHRFKQLVLAVFDPDPKEDSELTAENLEKVDALTDYILPVMLEHECDNDVFTAEMGGLILELGWDNLLESTKRLSITNATRLLLKLITCAKQSPSKNTLLIT